MFGENFSQKPDIFEKFENRYNHRIVQFGFVDSFADYAKWLWKADIIPVTSIHEFFGISVVEAIHCNCYPILPKRLSYPEFIPVKENSYIFYKSQKDLMIKLKHAIMNIDTIRSSDYSEYVAKYDWSYMASQYDKTLASVVSLMH